MKLNYLYKMIKLLVFLFPLSMVIVLFQLPFQLMLRSLLSQLMPLLNKLVRIQ
ncbi:hypothetical protein BCR36DRAFT_61513 [Piromyces finnis]|uniref:Uncharacterized protein n=1 Tax=Piromyces finnis TaxID=1754191 RepID=A0A1Y1U646_9FUNG|nr:hypothetical protein BCR36DRAFT_61513 [Piromyces finnis]|eukprot:ORX33472.1 hypothetical protein BCR36DRAFT_61513 [Piromyces finnis]